jgi:hypothetical protein
MGKHRKRLRGVHKKATSPETILWDREHMPPPQPVWMPAGTYSKLVRLRNQL